MLSEYKHHDAKEENTAEILTALESGDKGAYRKSAKRKFKARAGVWGFIDRLLGGLSTGLNVTLTLSIVISFVFAMVDFARIDDLTNLFKDAMTQQIWLDQGVKYTFDLIFVSIIYASIRIGFKGGISSALCTCVIIGLLVLSGYLSYHLAFDVQVFIDGASQIANGALKDVISSIASISSAIGIDEVKIGQIIILCALFVAFLIAVIIIGIFLPKVVEKFRGEAAFYIVDGILGAAVLTAIVFALIAFLFGALYTISDLPAMDVFNTYIYAAPTINAVYQYNPLQSWTGLFTQLPIRSWFVTES
jgi:hypothetical protein